VLIVIDDPTEDLNGRRQRDDDVLRHLAGPSLQQYRAPR
jgi:hypothetical protein